MNLAVNKIPALSLANNAYTFDSSKRASVTTWSYAANKISFTLDKSLTAANIHSVTMGGSHCANIAVTASTVSSSNFECTIYQLQAGNAQKPQILIKGNGFAYHSSVTTHDVPLIVTSITPNNCNFYGEVKAVIVGTGFPVDLQSEYVRKRPFSIQICGKQVNNILSITN